MNTHVDIRQIIEARVDRFKFWRPQIEKAIRASNYYTSFDCIVDGLLKTELLWFENESAFVILQVIDYDLRRDIHILIGGGNPKGLVDLESVILKFGNEIGAKLVTMICRKGLWPRLQHKGWKMTQHYVHKEII